MLKKGEATENHPKRRNEINVKDKHLQWPKKKLHEETPKLALNPLIINVSLVSKNSSLPAAPGASFDANNWVIYSVASKAHESLFFLFIWEITTKHLLWRDYFSTFKKLHDWFFLF